MVKNNFIFGNFLLPGDKFPKTARLCGKMSKKSSFSEKERVQKGGTEKAVQAEIKYKRTNIFT